MTTEEIWALVTAEDPLEPLAANLLTSIWSQERYRAAAEGKGLQSYLVTGEHIESAWEREVYDAYFDIYEALEGPHRLKSRVEDEVLRLDEFTLVIFDALSLRELPAVLQVLGEHGLPAEPSYSLSAVPSETAAFCKEHFGVGGPSQIKPSHDGMAFRYLKLEGSPPDFAPENRKRLVWVPFPDTAFGLQHDAIDYGKHLVEPVVSILRTVLAAEPVYPLIITSDHGYLWQGGDAYWTVSGAEAAVLADHFKAGRSTDAATVSLRTGTDKAWLSGLEAAARGRFGWGNIAKGPTKLYKHGGVSLMECLVPWVGATRHG